MIPVSVEAPADEGALCEALARSQQARAALIAIGGATQLAIGNLPERYDRAIVTTHLDGIVAYDPADMTVTVQAGMPLAALQSALAAHGQFLPLDPPAGAGATVGGVLATNAQGSLRGAYGTARDWVIGMRVVQADGRAIASGGRVVKNVTGYDLHKLHIGALGTLGVISEVTFKLASSPRVSRAVCSPFRTPQAAADFLRQVHGRGLAVLAAELLSPASAAVLAGAPDWTALVRFGGGRAAVERSLREAEMIAAASGATGLVDPPLDDPWLAWRLLFSPDALSMRMIVPGPSVPDVVSELESQLAAQAPMMSASMASRVLRIQCDVAATSESTVGAVAAIASAAGAGLFIDAAPPDVKTSRDVFGPPRADLEIMRRIKHEYDPDRILAPGRFYGRL